MKIEISFTLYQELKELFEILESAKIAHDVPSNMKTSSNFSDDAELIESWHPSYWIDEQGNQVYINCPGFTVGVLRQAVRIKEKLKL